MTTTDRVTVVVADDHPVMRQGVVRALKASGRVSYYRGIPTMFNPFYTIVPTSG